MKLHHDRRDARGDGDDLVALEDQDRARWRGDEIDQGRRHLHEALARGRPGPYQIQAAIAALHAGASTADRTTGRSSPRSTPSCGDGSPPRRVGIGLTVAEGMALARPPGSIAWPRSRRQAGWPAAARSARADLLRRAGQLEAAAAPSDRERRYQ